MRGSVWTRQEWESASALLAAGKSRQEVALTLDRTLGQLRQKIHYEGLSPARREILRKRVNARRRALAGGRLRSERKTPSYKIFEKAPSDILDDRNHRQLISHPDLTSAFFGDPLPGYSALDRRP